MSGSSTLIVAMPSSRAGIEVAADVVEEREPRRRQGEPFADERVDPRIGLPKADDGGLHEDVEVIAQRVGARATDRSAGRVALPSCW